MCGFVCEITKNKKFKVVNYISHHVQGHPLYEALLKCDGIEAGQYNFNSNMELGS